MDSNFTILWIIAAIVLQVLNAYQKALRESPIAAPPQPAPKPATKPAIAAPITEPKPAACPADSLPVSGPTLDMYLAFDGYDSGPIAKLVPGFVGNHVTIVYSFQRPLRQGWCEYRYRLRGPESILKGLCAWLESKGYQGLTAMW